MYENHALKLVPRYKKGSGIHIKESTKGSFTKYCNGKVTNECIQRGKNSPDPKIRKKAIFAQNSRKWKHQFGGLMWADAMQFANDTFQKSGLPASQPHSTQMDIDVMNQQQAQAMAQKQQAQKLAEEEERARRKANNEKAEGLANSILDGGQKIAMSFANAAANAKQLNNQADQDKFEKSLQGRGDALAKYKSGELTAKQAFNQAYAGEKLKPGSLDFNFDDNGDLQLRKIRLAQQQNDPMALLQQFMQFYQAQSAKKGGKIKNKKRLIPKVHQPFGHVSVLDDTGVINPRTLKLK